MTEAGIVGLRFSQSPRPRPPRSTLIEPLAKRVADYGWHIQIYMPGDMIAAAADLWNRLPMTLVFDHMGHLPAAAGCESSCLHCAAAD
jgi:predicted TIM-barrel fold metal-dependent hydrolase